MRELRRSFIEKPWIGADGNGKLLFFHEERRLLSAMQAVQDSLVPFEIEHSLERTKKDSLTLQIVGFRKRS